jgi:iron(III) transport system ATP-binding protein|tara:strand:+ start:205 stop:846 length:642 start_codon:yes stop_codon:yes gene_type:complete
MFLKIKNLTFFHKKDLLVLNKINLNIDKGEYVSILGSSGSGKTTLLRVIAGLEKQDSGSIMMANEVISNESIMTAPEKRNIGLVVQDKALFPHLNVIKNIMFGIRNQSNKQHIANDIMKLFKIEKHKNKFPHELSGGEQQRVALARSLAPNPKLLLMDEPFDGLDEELKSELHNEVQKIVKLKEITVIMVTHDHNEAKLLSDKIFSIEKGKVN